MARILIIDDSVSKRELLQAFLTPDGHTLLEADDGGYGLLLTRLHHPDLVIADLAMPSMTGYDYVRYLRADPTIAHIPVVFFTSVYNYEKTQFLAQSVGVGYVIPLEAEQADVQKIVHAALAGAPDPLALSLPAFVGRLEDVIAELNAISASLLVRGIGRACNG